MTAGSSDNAFGMELFVCLSVYRRPVLGTGQCTENMITVNDRQLSFLCVVHLAKSVEQHNYRVPQRQQLSVQLNAATLDVQAAKPPLTLSSKRSAQKARRGDNDNVTVLGGTACGVRNKRTE